MWLGNSNRFDIYPSWLLDGNGKSLLAYQPLTGRWFSYLCETASPDWTSCLFGDETGALVVERSPPILFLNLDSTCGQPHNEYKLLDFIRFLRLSRYHPEAWSRLDYHLWRSPLVCHSFESKEQILKRRSEALVLYAPSVLFRRLPFVFGADLISVAEVPSPADENELARFVNPTKVVNLSAHHQLADWIGPFSILRILSEDFPKQCPPEEPIKTETLHEIYWQLEQEKLSDEDKESQVSADSLRESRKRIQATIADDQKPAVLVIDDQSAKWRLAWEELLGPAGGWQRTDAKEVDLLLKMVINGEYNDNFFKALRKYRLVILDLRLKPKHDQGKTLKAISGYQVLDFLRTYDSGIPILVFTGTQRAWFIQELMAAGTDQVCSKPGRLDTATLLLEKLIASIELLLHPEYRFLQETFYELTALEDQFKSDDLRNAPLGWARWAWREARQYLPSWLMLENTQAASAISVARTAGLASEAAKEISGSVKGPYVYALQQVRNVASHIKSAQVATVEIGYIAIGLAVKMLSALDEHLEPKTRPFRINSLDITKIEKHFREELHVVESNSLYRLEGSICVATLAYDLHQNANRIGLSSFLTNRLGKLERSVSDQIRPLCLELGISRAMLAGLIVKQPNLRGWLNGL